jgi:hypothetical protein
MLLGSIARWTANKGSSFLKSNGCKEQEDNISDEVNELGVKSLSASGN